MKNWMLFLALLISTNRLIACSWWPMGEEIRFSLFSSHLAEGDDISPLFYSAHLFNTYEVDEYNGPMENLTEWYNYFGGEFTIDEIDQVIYRYNYPKYSWGSTEKSKIDLSKNRLMIHLKNGKNPEAAEYLKFAIQLEEYLQRDVWGDKDINYDEVEKSLGYAAKKMEQVKDEYIKLRYAYQLVVMSYYLHKPDKVAYCYKEHVVTSPVNSVLKSWSQFYYAASLASMDEKFYEWSRVFDESKSKCKFIYQHYPSDKSEVEGALNLCKNDAEKGAILSILAFKNPGRAQKQIKEIAALNPNDELMDILLIREINKMEDWYFTDRYTGYGTAIGNWWSDEGLFDFIKEKNFQSDKAYLKDFKSMCEGIVKKQEISNKGLWYTSIAYMAYMLDDEKETDKYLKLADKFADREEVKGQLAVIELLHLVKHENEWSEKFQKKLMTGVKVVETFREHVYRYDRFHSQLMLAVSRKYLEEENLTLAALFETKVKSSDVYETYSGWEPSNSGYQAFDLLNENASSADMDEFFTWWNKSDKTDLEKWLFSDMGKWKWRMTDLWATAYFREDNLEKALEIYETIPDSVWHIGNSELHYFYDYELTNDPFETNLYGRSYDSNWGRTYTKPEFVTEIIRLRDLLENSDKDKAYNALLLGNAYYNMSYHGNSYYYTEYSWSSYESDDYPRDQSYYYTSERALKYYKLAEELAPNEAYAAFCHRMQLKCKRDSYYKLDSWSEKVEKDWKLFANKYPNHVKKLLNCDHFEFYSNAWKQG